MISFLNKYKKLFLFITVGFFIGSIGFVGAGVVMQEYGPNAPVAKVGDKKIKYKDFSTLLNAVERQKRDSSDEEYTSEASQKTRREVLQNMINEASLSQAAAKYGVGVSDLEVAYAIQSSPSFNNNGVFNKKAYVWSVRNNFGMNPNEYEKSLREQKAASKFQNMIILAAKVTPAEAELFAKADKETAKAFKSDKDKFSIALLQLKAQSLMDKFSQQFNAAEKIEIFDKNLGA